MPTSIGNLAVYLSADTGRAEKQISAFGGSVDKLDRKMRAVGSAEPKMRGLTAADRKARAIGSIESRAAAGLDGRGGRIGGAGRGADVRTRGREGAGKVVGDKLTDMAGLGEIAGAGAAGGPWAAVAVAALTGVTAAAMGVKKALDLAGQAEANRVAFETLLGSADKAAKMTAALDEYAAKTAFSASETAELGKQLLAVGVTEDQVMPALRTFGDIAGTLGGNVNERMKRLTKAFGDVKASGRLAAEELNQFSEAGVNLGDALAKTMGKPRDEIKKLASEGEIGFGEVAAALNSMVGPGGQFAGGADKFGKTWNGLLGQMGDGTDKAFRTLGTALMEDLDLKGVLGEGLKIVDQWPGKINEMRPGLKFLGDHLKVAVKLLGDSVQFGERLSRAIGAGAKAAFAPELKVLGVQLEKYKGFLADLGRQDFLGLSLRGLEAFADMIQPTALDAAAFVDSVSDSLKRIEGVFRGIQGAARDTFDGLSDGFKLLMLPIDLTVAKLKLFGEVMQNPLKALDAGKLMAEAMDDMKKFKFDGFKLAEPRKAAAAAEPKGMTAVDRAKAFFGAFGGAVRGMRYQHELDNWGQALGPLAAQVRQANPLFDLLGRQLDKLTGQAAVFGGALSAGEKKLSAALRDEAKKLTDEYADPLGRLVKKADELDRMRQFGAIDDKVRGLAFDAEVGRLLKDRGTPFRPAPNAEYGSQEFVRLVQQATAGGGPKDLMAAVRDLIDQQKEVARIGNAQLDELRKMRAPKLQKLPGE